MNPFQKIFVFYLLFSSSLIISQENRVLINGVIKNDTTVIENVHIINISSNKGSLSNVNGKYQISVKENDTLHFSDVQYEVLTIFITKEILQKKQLPISLKIKNNKLGEIVLIESKNMAKALHLPNAGKKPLNKLERRLNFYSQKSVPVVILLTLIGQSGGINDIYNIVSGNRKRDRKFKKLIEEDKRIELEKEYVQSIRAHFQDEFFIETLQLPSEKINSFINYCLPKNIVYLFEEGRNLEIMDIFIAENKNFKILE